MVCKKAVIRNSAGIHVRPSGIILQSIKGFPGVVRLKTNEMDIELRSVLELIAMGLKKGDAVSVSVSGQGEEQMCLSLIQLLENRFDFLPHS